MTKLRMEEVRPKNKKELLKQLEDLKGELAGVSGSRRAAGGRPTCIVAAERLANARCGSGTEQPDGSHGARVLTRYSAGEHAPPICQ